MIMRLRDKILYGFLVFVAIAPLIKDLLEGVNFGSGIEAVINIMVGVGFRTLGWYLIIKLLFWIYDRITKKSVKEVNNS